MSNAAKLWLPVPCPGEIESAIKRIFEAWLAEWLAEVPDISVARRSRVELRSLHWEGQGLARAGLSQEAQAILGLSVIGGGGAIDQADDRAILQHIGVALCADFAGFLDQLTGSSDRKPNKAGPPASERTEFFLLTSSMGWGIAIEVDVATITQIRRRAAGSGHPSQLGTRTASYAAQSVPIGCHLGHASLTAKDIASLGVGDLIVLDRRTDEPLPITIDGIIPVNGSAQIMRDDNGTRVTLTERINLIRKAG